MAIFKTGAGPGGNQGKGTKPNGKAKATPTKPGSKGVKSSQPPAGAKPMGKYGSAGKPVAGKPAGKHGGGPAPKRQASKASKPPSGYYKDRSGHPARVPKGQSQGKNTIPSGQNNTPSVKVGW